ncbi:hypothetical protein HN371_09405 [Candidatus Poribacteria bacterium]|jgi:hypothetical protein|nr:hypothetical protein [Candidatus Poribacteria bacterium]MBT5710122.1 hypothetical protein [Candidatus Poribacteria bacterium]MBT7099655.1 hypothetical protein [Candidatus Poribacteria bacterium]MBT7805221.1 hypothetical protein [Candidatus Poribacteria bacterium]
MRETHRLLLCMCVAVSLGMAIAACIGLVGVFLLLLSREFGHTPTARIAAGALVVLASVCFGALCGAAAGGRSREEGVTLLLVIGAGVVGAIAGALAFVTGGLAVVGAASLLGLVGAAVSARTACRLASWTGATGDGLPAAVRDVLR